MLFILSILILDAIVVYLVCRSYIVKRKKELSGTTALAASRLLYIRSIIHLVYTYSHDKEQLFRHLKTEMFISKILSYHIVENRCESAGVTDRELRESDKLFFQLHQEGFTPQELCVIFNLNNLNTVYVKCHRIKKKMGIVDKGKDNPEPDAELQV